MSCKCFIMFVGHPQAFCCLICTYISSWQEWQVYIAKFLMQLYVSVVFVKQFVMHISCSIITMIVVADPLLDRMDIFCNANSSTFYTQVKFQAQTRCICELWKHQQIQTWKGVFSGSIVYLSVDCFSCSRMWLISICRNQLLNILIFFIIIWNFLNLVF